jgi:hypothetical protein
VHGKFVKTITITTNDPAQQTLMLKLQGEVKTVATVSPNSVMFGVIVEGAEAQERRVKITSATDDPIHPTLPPDPRRLVYSLETKVPGKEYEVVIRLEPPFTPGQVNETLILSLDHPHQKSVNVICGATIVPKVGLEPTTIQMTEPAPGQPYRGAFHVVNRGTAPLKVLEATCEASQVKLAVKEVSEGHNFQVDIEAPADFAPPPQGVPIKVRTSDPDKPVLTLPLYPKPVAQNSPAKFVTRMAPSFSFKTLSEHEINNTQVRQNVTLLYFFVPDSNDCRRQLPVLARLMKEFEGKPVRLVLVAQKAQSDTTPEKVTDLLKQSKIDLSSVDLAVDMTNAAGAPFLVSTYPSLVILSRDGKVGAAIMGNPADFETRVKSQVTAALDVPPRAHPPQTTGMPPEGKAPAQTDHPSPTATPAK